MKKWDQENEFFIDEEDAEKIGRYRENLKEMDRFLGPYPYEIWERWKNLSSQISQNVLDKMMPLCGRIHSVLDLKGDMILFLS